MNNNVYAYFLLGAVVLAGLGGFYFSEGSLTSVSPEPQAPVTGMLSISIVDAELNEDSVQPSEEDVSS